MLLQEERVEASLRTAINGDWKYDIFAHSFRMVRPAQAIAWELGLAQEEIPLEARILSAVDAYDAMTSPRAYQPSLSVEEARKELARCSGQQFDPQVVEVFLRIAIRQPYVRLVLSQQQIRPEKMKPVNLDGSPHRYRRISRRKQQRKLTSQGA